MSWCLGSGARWVRRRSTIHIVADAGGRPPKFRSAARAAEERFEHHTVWCARPSLLLAQYLIRAARLWHCITTKRVVGRQHGQPRRATLQGRGPTTQVAEGEIDSWAVVGTAPIRPIHRHPPSGGVTMLIRPCISRKQAQ